MSPMLLASSQRNAQQIATLLLSVVFLFACPSRDHVVNQERQHDANGTELAPNVPKIILLIGDGMGRGQLDAASLFKYGAIDSLQMFDLPAHGIITTSSPTGITDSAASATAMATGAFTVNGRVGLDLDSEPVQNLVELAKAHNMATGIVTTTRIAHATPACFSAHVPSRGQYDDIAEQLAELQPNVILGGGTLEFERRRDGRDLSAELADKGYQVVHTASELSALALAGPDELNGDLLGLFADGHIPYVVDRVLGNEYPSLVDMTQAALSRLDSDPDGFFLMVEGGRIDHAGHANNLSRNIGETIAFDNTIQSVMDWAEGRDDITILVTADHETGGLTVLKEMGIGNLPEVNWRWGSHTNTTIRSFSQGPGSQFFDGYVRDHRWIHAVLASLISGQSIIPLPRISPNGHLEDLIGPSIAQTRTNTDDPAIALSRLTLSADAKGLAIGLEGLYRWDQGSTLVLIDIDYGTATGLRTLDPLNDADGSADILLSSLRLPALEDNGFGADLAFITTRGIEPKNTQILKTAGLRGLHPPYGDSSDLGAIKIAANFSDYARSLGENTEVVESRGLELYIRWQELYPGQERPPANAKIAIWALQLNEDGTATNQSLPPWPDSYQQRGPAPLVITPEL